jgi:hypothetical protein
MAVGSFLFLKEQIKDIIIMQAVRQSLGRCHTDAVRNVVCRCRDQGHWIA